MSEIKYQIQFSPKAEDDFGKLDRDLQKRIFQKLKFFEASGNPFSFAKKLENSSNYYRFRVGDYRIIFSQQNKHNLVILLIQRIGHRREIYE